MNYKKLWEHLHKSLKRSKKKSWTKREVLDKMTDMEIQEARDSFLPRKEIQNEAVISG